MYSWQYEKVLPFVYVWYLTTVYFHNLYQCISYYPLRDNFCPLPIYPDRYVSSFDLFNVKNYKQGRIRFQDTYKTGSGSKVSITLTNDHNDQVKGRYSALRRTHAFTKSKCLFCKLGFMQTIFPAPFISHETVLWRAVNKLEKNVDNI